MSTSLKAHLALFIVALLYGANYTIAKEVLDNHYIGPLGFILIRVSCGMLLFWLFHSLFVREAVERKDFGRLILCALFGVAINQMFFFSGLKLSTPINAALIMTTTPLLVLISSALIIGERITFRKIAGIIAGALGAIVLIVYGKTESLGESQLLGDLMLFVNAVSYAIYLVLVKSLMHKYNPITIVKWVFTIAIVFVFPFGFRQITMVEWQSFSWSIWGAVAYVVIGATFLTYLLNAYALKLVNPSIVSIYIYLQPLLATLIALVFVKDELSLIKVVAAILIFLGVYLVSSRSKRVNG